MYSQLLLSLAIILYRFYLIINNNNIVQQTIKLWNMFYLLFKHFDPFLNLFPSLYVPSIRKKAVIVKCMSIYLSYSYIYSLL